MKLKILLPSRKIWQPFCALLLSSCAANFQSPPLPATNPASVEAKQSVTSAAKPMLGPDALTQKTSEQLAASTPGTPSFEAPEMWEMHHGKSDGGMQGMQHDHAGTMKMAASDKKSINEKSYYTCPMHPQIHQNKPGKCPMCGMNLIKKEGQQ